MLNVSAAAQQLGCHPDTLRAWANAGRIPCYRTPGRHRRFRQEDLAAFYLAYILDERRKRHG